MRLSPFKVWHRQHASYYAGIDAKQCASKACLKFTGKPRRFTVKLAEGVNALTEAANARTRQL